MSPLEQTLAWQLKAAKLPPPVQEYQFHPTRKWRADFAWPDKKLLVEVEGGIYNKGRHVRGKGFEQDCEKYNHAVLCGYQLLRVTAKHIKSGEALGWVEEYLCKDDYK